MKIPFQHQGSFFEAEAEYIHDQMWVHFGGKTWALSEELSPISSTAFEGSPSRARGQRSTKRRLQSLVPKDAITAPMPGKIIKVLAQIGSDVQVGQVLIIMEAMKMEYTLKAERSAKISEVLVGVGQQVRLGDRLVAFVKEEEGAKEGAK
jgi:biotin carboxyl carrier protein